MEAGKKAKIITLAAAIVCLAVVGIYFFIRREEPEMAQKPKITQAEIPESLAATSESATQETDKGEENILDGLILLSGGTFRMGSPDGERQRQGDENLHNVTVSAFSTAGR